jgi:hypothetical protein
MDLLKQGEIRQEGAFSPITKRLKTISDQLQNTDVKSYNNHNTKNSKRYIIILMSHREEIP